jgi:methyl-accepting chemotaxis protein
MAEGASEQASSLEETSASLQEISAMTRQNADNARQKPCEPQRRGGEDDRHTDRASAEQCPERRNGLLQIDKLTQANAASTRDSASAMTEVRSARMPRFLPPAATGRNVQPARTPEEAIPLDEADLRAF